MSERKQRANRHSLDRAGAAADAIRPRSFRAVTAVAPTPETETASLAGQERPAEMGVEKMENTRISADEAQELRRSLEELRDEVRALGRRLDKSPEAPMTRVAEPETLPLAAPEAVPAAPQPPSVDVASLKPGGSGSPRPLCCKLLEFSLLGPGRSRSASSLAARKPFEMQLALDLSGGSTEVALPVLCQVQVRARKLGGGESSVVGEASVSFASASETARLRCDGLPLAAGLYRFEASAALRGPQGTGSNGAALLDGGIVRVV